MPSILLHTMPKLQADLFTGFEIMAFVPGD